MRCWADHCWMNGRLSFKIGGSLFVPTHDSLKLFIPGEQDKSWMKTKRGSDRVNSIQ